MKPPARRRDRRAVVLRALKIGLPLVAIGVFASLFLFNSAIYDGRISFEGVDVSALDDGLRLTNPRFTGATSRGEPFVVTAEWALPDGPQPEKIELSKVKGEIELVDGRVVTLAAETGMIRPNENHVALSGGVRLETSEGYIVTAMTAALDAKKEVVTAAGDVVAESALGRITAETMRATRAPDEGTDPGEGAYIWFENRVRVRIEAPMMERRRG
ncbi:hypothetical protein G5B40_02225 [Pikeienuella piscinae]|uniref:LPS export ABC transporter periplasmic protein LptC n=1 Tax=Pikeienuella piscinae TaxID=2748098 RepID=A0A7L5BSJ5_9RHOB|nr:hypothetical protein [Pikeienuella piscinae]QIE54360.1 hypothetical protein G5B40_02225 [Pikeienuella piscinae]